jgi:RNA polymerase sigma factor (sigma-70 family)
MQVTSTNVQGFTGKRSLTPQVDAEAPTIPGTEDLEDLTVPIIFDRPAPRTEDEDPVTPSTEFSYRPISATLAIAPSVSVIIPARNEAANLAHVFAALPLWVDEVILVDGHSADDTVAVTRALYPQAKVITQPGKGKGDALQAGFAAATGEIIVMIDADGSTDGREMIRFVSALVAGADFAKGSRFSSSGGSDDITGVRRYGNWLLGFLVNRMFGTHFTDLCYGYNAFWARHLDVMELSNGPGFEVETLMSIRAAKAGLKIYEVPSYEWPRISGESNLRAVRDGWRILMVIMREWLRGSRKRGPRKLAADPASDSVTSGIMAEIAVESYRGHLHDSKTSEDHAEIAAAIAAGDVTGVAVAYDRYAEGLYTYCRSWLAQPAEAADAVQDAFIIASARVSELSQPDRLQAWLFAVARYECHLRLRDAVPSAQLYETTQAMDDTGAFAAVTEAVAFAEQAEYRALVRAALAGLDPLDREVSELNLLHGFDGADLAAILGTPRSQAQVLAKRARSRLEKSLSVPLIARTEREHCHELAAILDGQGGTAIRPLRWRVKQHIGRCEICGGRNPGILASLLPVVPPPSYLRERILELVSDDSPAAVAHRAQLVDRAARLHADGFPVQLTTPSMPGSRLTPLSVAAAAAALAMLGGAMYYVNNSTNVGNLAVVGGPPRLIGPTGSSASTRPPATSPAAPAPSPAADLVPTAPGVAGSVPSLLFTRPSSAPSTGLQPSPSSSSKKSPSPKNSSSSKGSSSPSSSPSSSSPPSSSPPSSSPPSSSPPSSSPPSSSPPSSSPPSSSPPSSSPPSSTPPSSTPPSSSPPSSSPPSSSPSSSATSSAASSVAPTASVQLILKL